MAQIQLSPLTGQGEIRVVQLLTKKDHPRYATGPVHCRIEHVSLDTSCLTPESSGPTIGFDGTWPIPVVKDIEAQPRIRKDADSNVFWKRNLMERLAGRMHSSLGSNPPFSKCGAASKTQTDSEGDVQAGRSGLPWRYTWGDYVALSYAWGDSSVKCEMYLDDHLILVSESLEAALGQLRNHSRIQEGFRIWIDVLCINQADLDERAAQIAQMREIFGKAWRVVVWLGPEAKNCDLAMMAIRFLSIRSQDEEPFLGIYHRVDRYIIRVPCFQWKHQHVSLHMRKTVLHAIYYFLTRSYWRRLWIIQEVALAARKSPVLCGNSCILLEDVYNALQLIQEDGAAFGRYIINLTKGFGASQRAWDITKGDTYTISDKLWERPIEIMEAQAEQGKPDAQTQVPYSGTFGALLLSRDGLCSDERDRVYGILGLPCLKGVVDVFPDYTRTPIEIFTNFSESLFMSGDLNCLCLISSAVPPIGTRYFTSTNFSRPRAPKLIRSNRSVNQGCKHLLPSWVICSSCPRNPALPLPRGFSALATKPYSSRPMFRDRLMIVQGVYFDTLSNLSAFHATESDRLYPQNGPRRMSIYGSGSATKEAFWRTLVANTDRFSQAAPKEYETILHPSIWNVGIPGVDAGVYGLKSFYQRNKSLMIFDQTLRELIHSPKKTRAQSMGRNFQTTGRLLRATQIHRDATLRAMRILAWRRLVTTHGGYLGLVPAGAIAGDVIAVIMGCDVPLLLRPAEGESGRFTLIGECYIHGIMSGEVREFLEQGKCSMDQISIC